MDRQWCDINFRPLYACHYKGPGQKYREYRAPYQYGQCRALKSPVRGYPHRFIHLRDKAPVTTGHGSLKAHHFGNHSLKLQGFIGIVALQGSSGLYIDRIDTVPYILHTFDRVLRIPTLRTNSFYFLLSPSFNLALSYLLAINSECIRGGTFKRVRGIGY
jgi:hypothetical protein